MIIYQNKIFKNPVDRLVAFDYESFFEALNNIEELRKRYYIIGYIRYDAKNLFVDKTYTQDSPLLYFEVFESFKYYQPKNTHFYELSLKPSITFEEYSKALTSIKNEIKNGNTYEVNYTYDWNVDFRGNALDLYEYLLHKQKTPYNAFFSNEYDTVLSFSPELFFTLNGNHILTKPMKGTIARGCDYVEDKANVEFLKNDIKNRAENVMIVDLLRNDLGQIAKIGSVKVDKLFEIETHKTLHQMTSEISADLRDDIRLRDIITSIFPCGSITGAPKVSTMRIIDRVETGVRDVYCGAIGFITPDEMVFSVPIRILQKKAKEAGYRYRVGGAVVWDSDIQDEWEETVTKTKFLETDYSLIETIKVENGKMFLGDKHLERLKKSANKLGFKYNEALSSISPEKDGMMRILLHHDGSFNVEYKKLEKSCVNKVKISSIKINSKNPLIYHKTTYRPYFIDSYKKIASDELYDELFFNEKGELTEGARTNILIEKDRKFYTPALSCGLLNGVLRQNLLDSKVCEERILKTDDLKNADSVYCINSVRGIKKVYCDFN